jgi:hypothetical protein
LLIRQAATGNFVPTRQDPHQLAFAAAQTQSRLRSSPQIGIFRFGTEFNPGQERYLSALTADFGGLLPKFQPNPLQPDLGDLEEASHKNSNMPDMSPQDHSDLVSTATAAFQHHSGHGTDLASVLRAASAADPSVDQMAQDEPTENEGFAPRRGFTLKRTEEPPRDENNKMICAHRGSCSSLVFDRKCEWR